MRRALLLLIALALAAPLVAAAPGRAAAAETRATASQQAKNLQLGKRLTMRFWDLLVEGTPAQMRAFLSPAFQAQRANGSGANRNQYVASFARSIKIADYTLSDFRVTRSGGLVVVRYWVVTSETINGVPYATAPAPRLSTYVAGDTGWRMASHANFNAPS